MTTLSPEAQLKAIDSIRRSLEGAASVQILVVEDDKNDADITIATLRESGLQAELATGMSEVLPLLRKTDPQIVFLDLQFLQFPAESGLKILRVIKNFKPDALVVVLTGAYEHDSAECKEALKGGATAVMLKPLTMEQVRFIFGTP